MVQPDCAGVIPLGPVSWYGVARPCADSGFAGTMMEQLTLAAVVVAVAVLVAVALGHGVAVAELVGVAVVVPVAAVVAVAVPEAVVVGVAVPEAAAVPVPVAAVVGVAVPEAAAVGDAVPPPWWCAALAGLAGTTYAAGEAQLAFAASAMLFVPEWLRATKAPTTTASATGMATGTAKRDSGLRDRRPTDRCLLGMQSTSRS